MHDWLVVKPPISKSVSWGVGEIIRVGWNVNMRFPNHFTMGHGWFNWAENQVIWPTVGFHMIQAPTDRDTSLWESVFMIMHSLFVWLVNQMFMIIYISFIKSLLHLSWSTAITSTIHFKRSQKPWWKKVSDSLIWKADGTKQDCFSGNLILIPN